MNVVKVLCCFMTLLTFSGCGTLKVCKVHEDPSQLGTPTNITLSKGEPLTIPAGPSPGGYCQKSTFRYLIGTVVTVEETVPANSELEAISVEPPYREVSQELAQARGTVRIGKGVTEITFVNRPPARSVASTTTGAIPNPGYLEICKHAAGAGTFNFQVEDGWATQSLLVEAGTCSPPLRVQAGTVTVREMGLAPEQLKSCRAFPDSRSVSCNHDQNFARVDVMEGDRSTQTILHLTN